MLRVENINAFFGAVQALRGISLTVEEAENLVVFGRSGTGKTIAGIVASGSVSHH